MEGKGKMVSRKFRKISVVLALTMGLTMMTGCGKKKDKVKADDMIEKYSAFCELGEYKGIEYEKTEYKVSDDDVEYQIESLLTQYSTTDEVKEGTVEEGDTVNIDFVGKVDGVEFAGGNSNGQGYDITLGSGKMIPGFEEAIVGHSVGEKFDIDVTFPDDYQKEEELEEGQTLLNGKAAVFAITINSKKVTNKPEYNDAFVASNTDYANVSEYESELRKRLEESAADRSESANRSAVITVVEENSKITEYPEQELKKLIDDAIESVSNTAKNYGTDLATYVTVYYGMKSEDEFREYVSTLAESFMKEKIIICAIAKAEGISVSSDDISAQKTEMMEELGIEDEAEFNDHYTNEDVIYYAISEKVYKVLLDNAKGVLKEEDEKTESTTEADTETTTETTTDSDATATDASASDAE